MELKKFYFTYETGYWGIGTRAADNGCKMNVFEMYNFAGIASLKDSVRQALFVLPGITVMEVSLLRRFGCYEETW